MKAAILLVDDHPDIGVSLGHTLRLEGYDVTLASNGQEALNALRSTSFGLVLLDLDLLVPNAWETLGHLITVSLSLPLIIITGHPGHQRLAAQKGVTAVLEKPLHLPLLLGVIERALAETPAAHGDGTRQKSL
jgi:DNA-binding NtrC family response regulator